LIQEKPVVNPKKRKVDGMTPKWSNKNDESSCKKIIVVLPH